MIAILIAIAIAFAVGVLVGLGVSLLRGRHSARRARPWHAVPLHADEPAD